MSETKNFSFPSAQTGLAILRACIKSPNLLTAVTAMHHEMGEAFRIPLPFFNPVFVVGPQANRLVLVTQRDDFRWRPEGDPVTALLRHGVLVEDGEAHDTLRRQMNPSIHRRLLPGFAESMLKQTDQVLDGWQKGQTLDMLIEMRKVALLIIFDCLFGVDFSTDLPRLWRAVLRNIEFISPGMWIFWPNIPRPGFAQARKALDDYLFGIIQQRRRETAASQGAEQAGDNLLNMLIAIPDMSDDLIRDQLLTMLIAGHDTSTALLAWTLYLLGTHPDAMEKVVAEVDAQIGANQPNFDNVARLDFLEQVTNEALRLYPPIHVGNRTAAVDLEFEGWRIPAGTRVMYSIYLSHRQARYWPEPDRFMPERFSSEGRKNQVPYTFVPFGGGPRNCIGLAFANVEVKIILARLLQRFRLSFLQHPVYPNMGATLEPRPGVMMRVEPRLNSL